MSFMFINFKQNTLISYTCSFLLETFFFSMNILYKLRMLSYFLNFEISFFGKPKYSLCSIEETKFAGCNLILFENILIFNLILYQYVNNVEQFWNRILSDK